MGIVIVFLLAVLFVAAVWGRDAAQKLFKKGLVVGAAFVGFVAVVVIAFAVTLKAPDQADIDRAIAASQSSAYHAPLGPTTDSPGDALLRTTASASAPSYAGDGTPKIGINLEPLSPQNGALYQLPSGYGVFVSKEQQKRIGSAEFRNTQFSYRMGVAGVETFVSTPELQNPEGIGNDPLPPGHVWGISPGGQDEAPGLYRIEVSSAAGGGNVRITNVSPPGSLRESVQTAHQNLLGRNRELVGDRDARQHELNVQIRAMDVSRGGTLLGVPILLSFVSAILEKSLRGGLVVVGGLSVGGSFELIYNAVAVAELAIEKGAQTVLFPVSTRRQLFDLSDEMAAKLNVVFYTDPRDALLKALTEL